MIGVILDLGPWSWIILGVVLIGLELAAPGVFLLWLGLAAVLTGLADAALDLSWQGSALLFALLAVGAVLLGRVLTRQRDEEAAAPAALNRRAHALIGREFTLETAIEGGSGRVRVDDSSWRVVGPDAPAGTRVRVVRADGAILVVERA